MNTLPFGREAARPSNKGRLIGKKLALKLKRIWAIRIWLRFAHWTRKLALFNLGPIANYGVIRSIRMRGITLSTPILPQATVWLNIMAWPCSAPVSAVLMLRHLKIHWSFIQKAAWRRPDMPAVRRCGGWRAIWIILLARETGSKPPKNRTFFMGGIPYDSPGMHH